MTEVEEVITVIIERDRKELTWKEAIAGLRASSPALRSLLSKVLGHMPYASFKWECTPLSKRSMSSRPFECVVHDYPGLAKAKADPSDFSQHIADARGQEIARRFLNLNGDCTLVQVSWLSHNFSG